MIYANNLKNRLLTGCAFASEFFFSSHLISGLSRLWKKEGVEQGFDFSSCLRGCFRGIFVFVLLLLLSGCSSTSCREWEFQEIITQTPYFNGSRLLLAPDSEYSHLELEIVHTHSGDRFYVNLLFLQASSLKGDQSRTALTIQFENQDPWVVYPYILEGGQRLLLPGDVADFLIQSIIAENEFTIQIGRSKIHVVSAKFKNCFDRL